MAVPDVTHRFHLGSQSGRGKGRTLKVVKPTQAASRGCLGGGERTLSSQRWSLLSPLRNERKCKKRRRLSQEVGFEVCSGPNPGTCEGGLIWKSGLGRCHEDGDAGVGWTLSQPLVAS